MIRTIIADDQILFCSMLEQMLSSDDMIKIVATCGNGKKAVELAKEYNPDVVILDIGMPEAGGLYALKIIKTDMPGIKVIMLTTFENDESIMSAIKLGADGYLVKDIKPDVLIMSIKCIHNNIVLFNKTSYDMILSNLQIPYKSVENKVEIGDIIFDSVDASVIKYIALGKTNKEIAMTLNYSEGTIKNKVSKILNATGLKDRNEISVFAIKNRVV